MSDLTFRVEPISPVVQRLEVEVPAGRVQAVSERILQRLAATTQLRGYRKGKVPRRLLEQNFAEQVRADTARSVVEQTLREAMDMAKLEPVAEPSLELQELKVGQPYGYSARVEVRPKVTLQQYKGLSVPFAETVVDDAAVEAAVEQMRDRASTVVAVEGRDVLQAGDIASIDYDMAFVGSSRAPAHREDASVRVEEGRFIDGRGGMLAGMKVGESRQFNEAFEGEDVIEELKGTSADITVTLKGIKQREKPALDDDFARDQGADDLASLRASTRQRLEEEAAENNTVGRRDALLRVLLGQNPFEVPPSMVESAADDQARRFVDRVGFQGMKSDMRQSLMDTYRREMREQAVQEVRSYFALEAVAEAEEIKITKDDIDAWLNKLSVERGQSVEELRSRYLSNPNQMVQVFMGLRNERALAIVESSATFVAPTAEAAGSDSAA